MGGRGATVSNYTTLGGVGGQFNQAARKIQGRIKNLKNERGYYVDSNGNILHEIKGKGGEVSIPKEVTNDVEDRILYNKESIGFIHNHPDGGTFSADDVWSMTKRGIQEYRATSKDGTYVLKTKNGKPMYDMRFANGAMELQMKLLGGEALKVAQASANSKGLRGKSRINYLNAFETDYTQKQMDKYYRENAGSYGLTYQFVKGK